MASVMSNPLINTRRRHKKKSLQGGQNQTTQMINNNTRWRTATEQHNYSSKLLQALSHVCITPSSATRRGRAIRQTADRVLAMTAKGRTRWSRAMLTNRLILKFLKAKKPKLVSLSRTRKPRVSLIRGKNLPAVQKKALVLGNLVPGCRKQPLPVILEEAHDYISALEMQVRAMTALAELLSVAGAVSSSQLSSPPRPAAP